MYFVTIFLLVFSYLRVIIIVVFVVASVVAFVSLVNLFLFSLSCAAFHRPPHFALGSPLQQQLA